jgi:beta-lactamase superfamily II metal-dependent hydrolase
MRALFIFLLSAPLTAFAAAPLSAAEPQSSKALNIYVVDVEGGNATLFVTPSGESLLIDTGNIGAAAPRDAGRIMAAMKDAGVQQIDHLIITHWHGDHFGGLAELASHVTIKEFIDHGPNVQPAEAVDNFLKDAYPKLYSKARHTVAKPGDKIAIAGLEARVVASAGNIISSPLPGAGKPNPECANFKAGENNAEDPQSVGTYFTFGKFRTVHLGDLTRNKEFELMCPVTRLGPVDVLLGLHHGQASSNSEVMVHALHPRVAIMNDGTRKGGEPDTMKSVFTSAGLENLWELHFSQLSGQEYTVPGMFIANTLDEPLTAMPVTAISAPAPGPGTPPPPVHNGTAYWIKVSAQQDGTFTVTNARNGFSKTYKPGL